ncbi:G_PROTEIN_RECEP_F1_2 domain-containing protein [Caenorhabditis elegans]|uniref:G_PROTEIN_RECEP_F1_2 domain-containing protein n=1 Tax=Caenorhabditis elegans TaxID=6239 RepID=H2KYB4_CAEEL|nr:G_PROTEIN_RECEP_F1_2 domain-containing protein [Caenorhabditis elegans]CCD62090.1 G_PROTEIN_RECEP_F1_2 domain-containing protein [Caenorhabditis elegans]|eukprot:NP_001256105.1 Uncharacterized protein CELE_ZC196.9 [Caenorhabditis elegans]
MEKRLEGPMRELLLDISDSEKNWLYYSVVSLFVVSTIGATILTMSFLVLSILLWRHFKSMRFFWFLTQLTTSAFVISAANLFINIPAALSLFSKEVTQSHGNTCRCSHTFIFLFHIERNTETCFH